MDHLFLGALLRPLFWLVVLGLALWAVRRLFPEHERDLFERGPIDGARSIIARLRSARARQDPPPE